MLEPASMKTWLERLTEAVLGTSRSSVPGKSGDDAQLSASGLRERLVKDAFNYFLSKIVPGLMGFFSVLVFVRMVGVEQYGRYAVVFAFVMASATGLAGWLSQGILRFQSQWREPDEAENFLRSAVAGTILSVAVGVFVLGIAIPVSGVQKGWPLLITLTLLGMVLVYTVTLARFQASLRSATVLRFEALRSIGSFLLPLVLMWATRSRDYRLLLLGIALGYSLPLFEPIFSRAKTHVKSAHRWRPSLSVAQRKVLSELWRFGWPVALWMLCQQALVVSDRYFIQKFAGYSDVGVYASMYDTIVRSLSLVFTPIALAVHPLVMNQWNAGSRRATLSLVNKALMYQCVIFLPILIVLWILGPTLSRLVFGRENVGAASVVLPLAIGGFLWQVSGLAHKPLEILCQTKRMLLAMCLALMINIIGNFILVRNFGYKASAYLVGVSALGYLIALFIVTPRESLRRAAASSNRSSEPRNLSSNLVSGRQSSSND